MKGYKDMKNRSFAAFDGPLSYAKKESDSKDILYILKFLFECSL